MRRIVPAFAIATVLVLGLPAPPAAAAQTGQFVLRCTYSHTLPDDPIVVPGQPGAAHLHDFFGNTEANAFSTMESMLAGETTCRVPSDTAGYWTPTAFLNGVQIEPTVMRIYYIGSATRTPETIPPGLQIVGGNRDAASAAENPHVSWSCGRTKAVITPRRDAPYDCTPWSEHAFVDGIVASIDFPSCWNGVGLRPEDVAYSENGVCPPGFGHVIPKLSERVHFGVMNPMNADGTLALTLSSGPWYTLHADFWNTWQQDRLDQLVEECLVAKVHCGTVDATSTIEWSRQFGTQRYDLAYAAALDGHGGSYVVGFTNYALEGQTYHRRYDAFVRRYNAKGRELWTRQFGTNGTDQALAIAVDGARIYVAGSTDGRFPKQDARGGLDAFVASFDASGTPRWLTQFGSPRDDAAAAISSAEDGVHVAGTTGGRFFRKDVAGASDAFLLQLDRDGEIGWTRTVGGAGIDAASAVGSYGTRVYVAGSTEGLHRTVADLDGFVAAFDRSGARDSAFQIGHTDDDAFTAIVPRRTGVYIAGWTNGRFLYEASAGGLDAVVGKLGPDGGVAWSKQFGSAADDDATALAVSGRGVYVSGSALGPLPDGAHLGESDGFLRRYLPNGTEIWTRQFGTDDYDRAYGMAADAEGVVVVGTTHGAFEGYTNAGDRDVFAVRIAFT